MLPRKLDDPVPALGAQRAPARILEGRDQVEERGRLAGTQRRLERVGVEPVLVAVQGRDLGTELAQDLQRAVVRRLLDEHALPRRGEAPGQEDEALQRAVGQEDP